MPDSSDNYQLPSWPPIPITKELWNAVMGSIAARLTAREALEADFEALIAEGTQASLDYIQTTVAPQIATLQTSITLAQAQIEQIVIDGVSPNSLKLGGQLPAYYATAAALAAGLDAKVPNTRLVAGKPLSADVTLVKGDVGLGNVNNTADADKPISTAQAAALATKLNTSGGILSGDLGVVSINGGAVSGLKNLFLNPLYLVDQNGMNTGNSVNLGMVVDGWGLIAHANGVMTVSRIAGTRVPYALQLNTNTALAQSAAQIASFLTAIEGYDIATALWGTAAAKPMALAFSAKATVPGTYSISIRNVDNTRSYVAPVVITAADTLQDFEIIIPGPVNGTWNITNGVGLYLDFSICCGADFQSPTPNTWLAGNYRGLVAQTNGAANIGNKLIVENPRLSIGDKATQAEFLSYPAEVVRCQRYECFMYHSLQIPKPGYMQTGFNFPVPMRVVPSVVVISGGSADAIASVYEGPNSPISGVFAIQGVSDNAYIGNRLVRYSARLF